MSNQQRHKSCSGISALVRKRGASPVTCLQNGIIYSSSAKEDFKCKIYTLGRNGGDIIVKYPVCGPINGGGTAVCILRWGFEPLAVSQHAHINPTASLLALGIIPTESNASVPVAELFPPVHFAAVLPRQVLDSAWRRIQGGPVAFFQDLKGELWQR